jgi:hypothetical protein
MITKKKYVLDVDYRWIDEIPLEDLAGCSNWICKGLWSDEWKRIYLVIPREGWTDEDYFDFARKRIRELGIGIP